MSDAQAQPYYALFSRLPGWEKRLEQSSPFQFKLRCPFHQEDSPSFHINVDTGVWTCFGKCARSGGPKEVEVYLGDVTETKAKKEADAPIDSTVVDAGHAALLANDAALQKLYSMGITDACIQEHRLGLQGERYMWPVVDNEGVVHNIRLYKPGSSDGDKVISFSQMVEGKKVSYGSKNTRLFPEIVARKNTGIFLCEGEKDALVLNSLGFAAVSATAGAGQWSSEHCNQPLLGKYVIVVYDVDEKGKNGAKKIALILKRVARRVQIANLPDGGLPKNGDVADFVALDAGIAKEWFQHQLDKILAATDEDPDELDNLGQTKQPRYHDRSIKVDAHVVGKETTPFTAERGYRLACSQSKGKICDTCPMADNHGEMEFIVERASKDLLYTIERTDQQIQSWISEQSGIPRTCNLWQHESIEEHKSSVEKILLSTTVDQRSYDGPSEYIQAMAYVVDSTITPNSVYTLSGRMTNHPKDQSNVFIVTKAETSNLSIDTFEPTAESHERLKFFQPTLSGKHGIMGRVDARILDLADNVTHIYRRPNTHLIVDLVAYSLLKFNCFGRVPDRCWLEGYVGGDTRQGKSEVAKRLHAHYRAGEIVVSENASLAGILGGAQKLGNGEWMVSWGKCPLNDRGWVTFDECQNISLQIMGALSGMRSSGVAEIDKIRVERVNSRTRILWLSNPRGDATTVDSLSQGIMLAKDVFGRPEDIARLDLMSVVRASDVDGSVVHEDHTGTPHVHTTELCHQLLMWAWSRKIEEISFTEAAANAARGVSERLGAKYNCDIKIVEPMEQRFKVARVAGALAALTYSTEDGVMLNIKEEHVQAAEMVFERLFDDPAVAYNDYAKSYGHRLSVRSRDEVWKWCGGQAEELLRTILSQPTIRMFDIQNFGDFTREDAQTSISFLLQQRALFPNEALDYVKNSEFVIILKEALAKGQHALARDFTKKGRSRPNEPDRSQTTDY